uniref:Putative salivary kunitz domain protein n=1 Tax=Ixodes ricinus TaxID=34613 RepID=A0A0K8R5U1_IXORI
MSPTIFISGGQSHLVVRKSSHRQFCESFNSESSLLRSCSGSCQSDTVVDVCSLDPVTGSGYDRHDAWFYDWRTGVCLETKFEYVDEYSDEQNYFASEEQCNSKCRRGVPNQCFDDPRNLGGKNDIEKWTYNYTSTQCVPFRWAKGRWPDKNTFTSKEQCIQTCRIPDLGICGYGFHNECKHGDDLYIRYNYQKQICEILQPDECPIHGNAFYTFRACYQRCGRFVEDKCKLPIQNMSFCSEVKTRYGYNTKTLRCEVFQGCEDSGNSFPSAEACWNSCAKASKHRCVQKPDYRFPGIFKKYYYDIRHDLCISKRLFRGYVSGDSNLFETMEDCKATCMATYKYDPDWL